MPRCGSPANTSHIGEHPRGSHRRTKTHGAANRTRGGGRATDRASASAERALLAAEALNALAGFEMETGALERAGEMYGRCLSLARTSDEVRGRIEQNLGILVNIEGNHGDALGHYGRDRAAFVL